MVWLKIRIHDISLKIYNMVRLVVVWLKIRIHDILFLNNHFYNTVVVWLKIRIHDIFDDIGESLDPLWFD